MCDIKSVVFVTEAVHCLLKAIEIYTDMVYTIHLFFYSITWIACLLLYSCSSCLHIHDVLHRC